MTTKNHGTFLRADTDNHPPGVVSDYVDVTDQGSDPSAPGAGHHALYTKAGGLYLEDSSATVVGPFIASALSNPMTTTGDIIYSSDNSGTPARRAIGGSNTVLHGGTTPTYGSVVETDFSFLDVTTANASTSKHGLLLKLNGSNATFLNGTGAWSTPAGSGSLEVKELDGSPDVTGVTIIQVSNGTLTDNGGGNVTITTGGGGGGGSGKSAGTLVQTYGGASIANGGTATLSGTPANGNLLLAFYHGNQYDISSISQTGVTWTKVASVVNTGGGNYIVWAVWAGAVGSGAGTGATFTLTGNNTQHLIMQEYSGASNVTVYCDLESIDTTATKTLQSTGQWPIGGGRAIVYLASRATTSPVVTPTDFWTLYASMPYDTTGNGYMTLAYYDGSASAGIIGAYARNTGLNDSTSMGIVHIAGS